MVERLATRFRALLGGRGEAAPAGEQQDDDDDLGGLPGPDPEWDELLAWARESEDEPKDEPEWEAVIARAKQAAVAQATDEEAEWGRLLALARAIPSAPRPAQTAPSVPAAIPHVRPPAGSITSLSARLERLAAQVPDARRRAR
jgi:hypothetical protein